MRILVTGGAGYVGSHVVQGLLEAGHDPVVYDNLSTGHAEAVSNAELVRGDVADSELLGHLLRRNRFDGCIHLAAVSLVGESVRRPSLYFQNNVAGGLALFNSLVHAGVPWVVLSSTAAVYGQPELVPIPEEHSKSPTNPYGESKLMLETVLARYEQAYQFRHITLRYFNAAGAHPNGRIGEDHTPETHLIPLALQTARGQRESLSVFGSDYPTPDGTAIRDYVHVCDLARAHLSAMDWLQSGGASRAYNLGSQHGYSVLEILQMAQRVTGLTIHTTMDGRRAGDPAVLVASSALARRELGWAPTMDLQRIVETAWQWHTANPAGYREHSRL